MYTFQESIDYKGFFVFDKKWISNMNWAALPKPSKAIFPVIASHCNRKGVAWPSERTIAILSGRPDKSVRAGISGLNGFPGFKKVGAYVTEGGKRGKRFYLNLPQIKKGETFPFPRCIIQGGNWSQLKSPTAAALYPVMRRFAQFDFYQYLDETDIEAGPNEFDEIYEAREFDFCKADEGILAEFAGISRRSIWAALDKLESKYLIEEIFQGTWKVFIVPPKYFLRDGLNKEILKRYAHERGRKK